MPGSHTPPPLYKEIYKNHWLIMYTVVAGGGGDNIIDLHFDNIPRLVGRALRFLSIRLVEFETPPVAHTFTPYITLTDGDYSMIAPTLTYTGTAAARTAMQFDLGHSDSHPEFPYYPNTEQGNISITAGYVQVFLDSDIGAGGAIIAGNMIVEVIDRLVINPYASEVRDTPGKPTQVEIMKPTFRFPFVKQ